jgi:hypothetical protein
MAVRRRGGVDPAVVIGALLVIVGAAFLLRTTGLLRVDWGLLFPLLLIGLGVLAVAGATGWGGRPAPRSWAAGTGTGAQPAEGTASEGVTHLRVPREATRRLELALRLGAGQYRLAGGAAELVEVLSSDDNIESTVERRGEHTRVRLAPSTAGWWPWAWRGPVDWRMGVANDTPTALNLQAGAGEFDMDLSTIDIVDAAIQIGAAQLRLVLPRPRGDLVIPLDGGAASIAVEVPAGVPARIDVTGLVSATGPRETPGYATARDRVTLKVSGGAASLSIVAR